VLDVRDPAFACRGDGVTDDTAGLQRALDTFAGLSARDHGPRLYVPPGDYVVNDTLVLANVRGGILEGAGEFRSILRAGPGLGGKPAILRLANCQRVTTRDLTILAAHVAIALDRPVSAGDRAIFVRGAAPLAAGASIVIATRAGDAFEVNRVRGTRAGGAVDLEEPVEARYSDQDVVYLVPAACWQSYNDVAAPGRLFNATANRCERVSVGSDSAHTFVDGFAVDCAGGSGGPSDLDNENHVFHDCAALNPARAAWHVGHANALNIQLLGCNLSGAIGLHMPAGGSFSILGGSISVTDWDLDVGGTVHHQCTIVGTVAEGASGFLRARASGVLRFFNLRAFGLDKKGGPRSGLLIDLTGTNTHLSFHACNLDAGAAPTLGLSFVESNPVYSGSPGSWVTFDDCDIGAIGFSLDRFGLVDDKSRWTASPDGAPHETLLHSAQVMSLGSYNFFGSTATQYRIGQLRGIRGISGPGARLARNLCGTVTIAGRATSAFAAFADPEVDGDYVFVASPSGQTGSPATGSSRLLPCKKEARGALVSVEIAPGEGSSVSFDWILMRSR
jgi:hypothetical protein